MKLMQSGRKYLAMLGIRPTQSLINVEFLFALFAYATDVGSNGMFFFYEANTFLNIPIPYL